MGWAGRPEIRYVGGDEPDRPSWSWLEDGSERPIAPRYLAASPRTYPNGWAHYPATLDVHGDGSVILDVGDTASPNERWDPPARNHEMYAGKGAASRIHATRTIMVKSRTAVPAHAQSSQHSSGTSSADIGGIKDAGEPRAADLPATAAVEIAIARIDRFAADKSLGVTRHAPWPILLRQLRSDLAALKSAEASGSSLPGKRRSGPALPRCSRWPATRLGISSRSPP